MAALVDGSGLFGVARHRESAHRVYLGLHALQHRGTGSVGMAASDGQFVRGDGLVQEALNGTQLGALQGHNCIGMVSAARADAIGEASNELVFSRYRGGQLAVAFTGRITNASGLRRSLKEDGALFQSNSDAELVSHLVAHASQTTAVNRLVNALWRIEGAFCALIATADHLVAVRDPRGFRPFWLGHLGTAVMFSTEEAAIRFAGGEPEREIAPGEMMIVDERGMQRITPFASQRPAACVQESISVTRSDSRVGTHDAWQLRVGLGERLAREAPCARGRVVIGVPGAGEAAAVGYGRAARIPYERGIVRAGYDHRDYAEPPSGVPDFHARLAYSVVPGAVNERAVVLVLPMVMIGDETAALVRMLRQAGAHEVHLRAASPPLRGPCPYGLQTPTADEISAGPADGADVARSLGADSLLSLSLDGLHAVTGRRVDGQALHCDACLSGTLPVLPEPEDDQLPLF